MEVLLQWIAGGITGASLMGIGIYVYVRQSALAEKQAEKNQDNTPKWLEFIGEFVNQTLKGFENVNRSLEGFSTRFNADSAERENIAREHLNLLTKLAERIDAESASLRDGHAANTVRLEALTAIVTAVSETALETRKEFKLMSDETRTRAQMDAEVRKQQHAQVVETLTEHGLKIDQINKIVANASVLNESGLDDLVGRLTKAVSADTVAQLLRAMADTQPIQPVQPDTTNVIQNVTVNPQVKPETKEETKTDDQP